MMLARGEPRQVETSSHWTDSTTAQHHANNDTKTRLVDALFAGDWDTVATLIHPNFELREPEALPYGGVYKGLGGFKEIWNLIPTFHRGEYLTTLQSFFSEDPNTIIVELDTRGTVLDSGKKYADRLLERFDFTDGKVSTIWLYWFNVP